MANQLRFHGATQEVTGSMHIIEAGDKTIALDCGLFHGKRAEANEKNRSFPVPPSKIDIVVLSHAHIDHSGKLPRLVKDGFKGPIYTTASSCDLLSIMLPDSAHIQQEDAEYWNKKRVRKGDAPIEPLYTIEDADATIGMLEPVKLNSPVEVADGIWLTLHEAGHMLGSAIVLIDIDTPGGERTSVAYTGDLGRRNRAILRDPSPIPECDYLICESTYGGRETPTTSELDVQLGEIINRTVERGGKLIIPAFAVGRTQVVVYFYHQMIREGIIKKPVPLIVDSPLAVKATDVFKRHPEVYDCEAKMFRKEAGSIFIADEIEYTRSVDDSKALHYRKEPMIIVSASGMCEAGRILHHLKNNIGDPKNTVLIVGYQPPHTTGRKIVDQIPEIKIFGELYPLRAEVCELRGFSGHADHTEIVDAVTPLKDRVKAVFLVHGEPEGAKLLKKELKEKGVKRVDIAQHGQVCEMK